MARGIVMYESLEKHCADFHLYVYAFDDACYEFLKSKSYKHLTVVSLKDFEDEELLRIKPTRTATEYCWTCTSSTILYSISNFNLDNCIYIDADMLFYSDPIVLFEEMGSKSVLITEHRYAKAYEQAAESGKYCVQFVGFKNDERGMRVLNWWRNACLEWCFNRHEDGKFGDQKYLDDWTERFEGVHVLEHLGGGIAPWNVVQYSFSQNNAGILGIDKRTKKKFEVVFFHFHGVKFYEDDLILITGGLYKISNSIRDIFYKPYIKLLLEEGRRISLEQPSINPNGYAGESGRIKMTPRLFVKYYFYDLKHSFKNVFGKKLRERMRYDLYFNRDEFISHP